MSAPTAPSPTTVGTPLTRDSFDDNQEFFLDMSAFGKKVAIRTTHREIMAILKDNAEARACGGRAVLEHMYRRVYISVASFDDDANFREQETVCTTKRSLARKAWTGFCNKCVLLQTLRLSLHNKPLQMRVTFDAKQLLPPPGEGFRPLKIRDKLKRAIRKSARG